MWAAALLFDRDLAVETRWVTSILGKYVNMLREIQMTALNTGLLCEVY